VYWAAVSAVPLAFRGPDTEVNTGSAASCRSAAATARGAAQAGWRRRSTMTVGLAAVCGKCLLSRLLPAAESLPAGPVTAPPNPAAR
jgi:hypothetical protein